MEDNRFTAKDGTRFDNILLCAEHDLTINIDWVNKINIDYRKSGQYFSWFEKGQCGDGGGANRTFGSLGLSREHFEVWSQKFKSSIHEDGYDVFKPMSIILLETSSIKKLVFYLKCHNFFYGLTAIEIYKILQTKVIYSNDSHYFIEIMIKYLKGYPDIKFEIRN